jgi:hypothetical protein
MRKIIVIRGKYPKIVVLISDEMRIKLDMKDYIIEGFTETTLTKNQTSSVFVIIKQISLLFSLYVGR